MRAVDTNVVLRVITRDDPRQADAADDFVREGAWISHIVLAEVAWALDAVYELSPSKIADAVSMLLDHESLAVDDADLVALALARFRAHPQTGFADCLILETARRAGHGPLGTFDRRLAKLPGTERL
jgi:predicted nucleic-acid-binding protein